VSPAMHIYKAQWLNHDGEAVYTVHMHPDATRFATGGNGTLAGWRKWPVLCARARFRSPPAQTDHTVRIWSLKPLEDEDEEDSEATHRLLATLTNHSMGVNCVRWSPDGQFLASCGDDKCIFLWTLEPGVSTVFGKENLENWCVAKVLKGHTGDVTGVCWSPDGTWLASCSTDNLIIIWNVRGGPKFGDELRRLTLHKDIVNGIGFDPTGSFLVSQGPGEFIFWRTSDWQMEKRIEGYFDSTKASSFFYRPSWSPDASSLAMPHVMSGSDNAAVIVSRGTGEFVCSFMGHREPTTVTAFNPQIFKHSELGQAKPYTMVAVGSQDGVISFWLNCSQRPLTVLVGLFETNAVTDMSWSPDGMKLLASSQDGTVLYVEFDTDEVGTPLSMEERKGVMLKHVAANTLGLSLLADPTTLRLQEQGKRLRAETAAPRSPLSKSRSAVARQVIDVKRMQRVTLLSDGRRRIEPVFLGDHTTGSISSFVGGNLLGAGEEPSEGSQSIAAPPPAAMTIEESSVPVASPVMARGERKSKEEAERKTGSARNTKRAAAPGVSAASAAVTAASSSAPASAPATKAATSRKGGPGGARPAAASASSNAVSSAALGEEPPSASMAATDGQQKKAGRAAAKKRKTSSDVSPISEGFGSLFESADSHSVRITADDPSMISQWLPPSTTAGGGAPCVLVLEAQTKSIRLQLDLHTLWEHRGLYGDAVLALVADEKFGALVVADGGRASLFLFHTLSGSLLCPRIALGCGPAAMAISSRASSQLLFVGTNAEVRVWDLVLAQCRLAVSASELALSDRSLTRCELVGATALPALMFSDGEAYVYDLAMRCWVCVHDSARYWKSDFQSGFVGSVASQTLFGLEGAVLSRMQTATSAASAHGVTPGALQSLGITDAARGDATFYHLEHQYLCALLLHSSLEFGFWVQCYVTQLVDRLSSNLAFEEGGGPRAPEWLRVCYLCDFLLDPAAEASPETALKRAVLKEKVWAHAAQHSSTLILWPFFLRCFP
jgi:WD40 repeat protein